MFETGDCHFGDVSRKRPMDPPSSTPKKPRLHSLAKGAQRKFPGPAGLLPDVNTETEIPCSQNSLSLFQSEQWLQMSHDYKSFIDICNINSIKTQRSQRAPFLAAVIQSIDCHDGKNPVIVVVLKDNTGEIHGTVIHSLYEEYASCLVVGAVLVLKQCAVLTVGNSSCHLNITAKNLVTVYNKGASGVVTVQVQKVSSDDLVAPLQPHNSIRPRKNEKSVTITCSQVIVNTNEKDAAIWENYLDGIDADSFFEDF